MLLDRSGSVYYSVPFEGPYEERIQKKGIDGRAIHGRLKPNERFFGVRDTPSEPDLDYHIQKTPWTSEELEKDNRSQG